MQGIILGVSNLMMYNFRSYSRINKPNLQFLIQRYDQKGDNTSTFFHTDRPNRLILISPYQQG